jgi:hypothetical protein
MTLAERGHLQMRLRLGGEIERLEHAWPGVLPRVAVEQPGPWIAPPIGVCGVDLAPAQAAVQLLQHAEHLRAMIGDTRGQLRV